LLLHSELALAHDGLPRAVAEKLRLVANLAGTLRDILSAPSHAATPTIPAARR